MEANVPTLYSAAALLFCAFLASRAALVDRLRRDVYAARWWILASVFLYLAVDELFNLHEFLGTLLGRNPLGIFGLDPGALFRRSWVFYGIVSRSWWCHMPEDLRRPSGQDRVAVRRRRSTVRLRRRRYGAFYARFEFLYGRENARVLLVIVTTIEEFLEMMGLVVAAYALSSYISRALEPHSGPLESVQRRWLNAAPKQ